MCSDRAFLAIAATTRAEQQHRRQRDPAAHCVHHDRTGEVVKLRAERRFQPRLHTQVLVPHNAFEERIHQPDQQRGRRQLRIEARTFGNAAGHNRGNGRRKSRQEEELDQVIAILLRQRRRIGKEVDAVRNAVADEKIRERRHGKIDQDLHQCIHLIFLAHGTEFQKRKPGMHRQNHDGAKQNEERVGGVIWCIHKKNSLKRCNFETNLGAEQHSYLYAGAFPSN